VIGIANHYLPAGEGGKSDSSHIARTHGCAEKEGHLPGQ
jgi:hypothetical protein